MVVFNTILDFIQNPENAWILYSIAIFMIIEAIFLRVTSKEILKTKDNNSDISVNDDADVNITQIDQASKPNQQSDIKSDFSTAIGIAANISGILGLILAVVTFYVNYMK